MLRTLQRFQVFEKNIVKSNTRYAGKSFGTYRLNYNEFLALSWAWLGKRLGTELKLGFFINFFVKFKFFLNYFNKFHNLFQIS